MADALSGRPRTTLILLSLALGAFAIGTAEFEAMSLLPYYARGFGASAPEAGHVVSAYALGVVVGSPLLAVAAARLSRRTALLWLIAGYGLANALSVLAPSLFWLGASRFVSGLPHGAFLGLAGLVAASLVAENRRSWAVSRVMLGLTVATVAGVPAATWIGQVLGWRSGFAIVTALALLSFGLLATTLPREAPHRDAGFRSELSALGRLQVWLTLLTGAVGFGGLFAVYTYLGPTLTQVTGLQTSTVPLVLCVFGSGLTVGNLVVPLFADRAPMASAAGMTLYSAAALALFPLAATHALTATLDVFLIGSGCGLATILQTRLMDVAGNGQGLAAALNHSAFNAANALGPYLGGLAIAAGWGWTSTGWVGCGLALAGFALWQLTWWDARRTAGSGAMAAAPATRW